LQPHDILLKFGDREISNLDDLVKAVGSAGNQEAKVTVLRAGKQATLTVKPAERPADEKLVMPMPRVDIEDLTKSMLKDNAERNWIWRIIGPGVSYDKSVTAFPDGLSISISKEKDQPAKITVTREGKTYETTQDRLDVLPKDVRALVERMLASSKAELLFKPGFGEALVQKKIKDKVDGELRSALEELKKADAITSKAMRLRLENLKGDEGALQDLRKAVEALRQEIEQLKEASKSKSRTGTE
jgi:hypothetical protein